MDSNNITFVATSDTHTFHNAVNLPTGDVFLHCGDFTLNGHPKEIQKFADWISSLDFKHKIVIAGNHDVGLDQLRYKKYLQKSFHPNTNFDPQDSINLLKGVCTYLEHESVTIEGYKIFGSPYSPEFCNWSFPYERGQEAEQLWSQIPDDAEIVLTHGPPYKIQDFVNKAGNVGCEELQKHILNRIKPLYHLFGHIHESYGVQKIDQTTFANVSACNLFYQPKQKPFVFQLPIKNVKQDQSQVKKQDENN